jgi:predicted O-methyltransferase YrrM
MLNRIVQVKIIIEYVFFLIIRNMIKAGQIQTHMTIEEKLKLYYLTRLKKPKHIVEIGSYFGASTCFIAEALNTKPDGKLLCIDTWGNDAMSEGKKDTFETFLKNTVKYKHKIKTIRCKSNEAISEIKNTIDLLFIDGDHAYSGVTEDINNYLPKLNNGALIIFHDYGAEGVRRAIHERIHPIAKKYASLKNMYWAWL